MPRELLHHDERLRCFGEGPLFVAVWHDAPLLENMQSLGRTGSDYEREHGPAALVNVAVSGVPRFAEDVRKIAARFTSDPDLFQVARLHVVTMPGFAGVAVRSFVNTFLLLGRPPRPTRLVTSVEDGAPWLAPHLASFEWTPDTLRDRVLAAIEASHRLG